MPLTILQEMERYYAIAVIKGMYASLICSWQESRYPMMRAATSYRMEMADFITTIFAGWTIQAWPR